MTPGAWLNGVHRTCAETAAFQVAPAMQQPQSATSTSLPWIKIQSLIQNHMLKCAWVCSRAENSAIEKLWIIIITIQPLQKVQNYATRLILMSPCHYHSTPLLQNRHWFPNRTNQVQSCMHVLSCYKWFWFFLPLWTVLCLHLIPYARSSSDSSIFKIQQNKRKTNSFHSFPNFGPHICKSPLFAQLFPFSEQT